MNTFLDIGACLLALVGMALYLAIYGPDRATRHTKETT